MTDNPDELRELHQEHQVQLAYTRLKQMAHWQAGFLGTASHELRAPINKIVSLHQLILEDLCESPEEEKEFLQQANQAIYQVLQNLDLLIQVSKLDIGAIRPQFQTVSLAEMLSIVHQMMNMKCLNRHCRLVVEPPPEAMAVIADRQWLQQLLMLLVDGALVAKSSIITLTVNSHDSTTSAIQMASEVSVARWQKPDEKSANSAIEQDETEFSPGFRYQIAHQMATSLNGTISCRAMEQGSAISVHFPVASL